MFSPKCNRFRDIDILVGSTVESQILTKISLIFNSSKSSSDKNYSFIKNK